MADFRLFYWRNAVKTGFLRGGAVVFFVCVSVCAAMIKLIVAMYVAHSVQIIKNLSRRRFGRVWLFSFDALPV